VRELHAAIVETDVFSLLFVRRDSADPRVARFYAECRRIGHSLHDKHHTGDRWVAACAIAKDVDLLAGDDIYRDAPGLRLLDGGAGV
jgi:hypothetical protein